MIQAFANIFRIPDLRRRVFFTLGMLAIYRIGFWIPLLGVDQQQLAQAAQKATQGETSGFGRILEYASIFSGGSLQQSTIFGLGIMPPEKIEAYSRMRPKPLVSPWVAFCAAWANCC